MSTAVVLLSGGLDSTTVLSIAYSTHDRVEALNVMYGQRHKVEIERARAVAKYYNVKLHEVSLFHTENITKNLVKDGIHVSGELVRPGVSWGGSSLLNDGEIPTARSVAEMGSDIPSTYVPSRNLFLVGLATSLAESIDADVVYVGFNALDYSGYPDCRPDFVVSAANAMKFGTKRGVEGNPIRLEAPIIDLSKADIVRRAVELKAPLHLTWSCYNPQTVNGKTVVCGKCDSCLLRAKGFAEVGLADPSL